MFYMTMGNAVGVVGTGTMGSRMVEQLVGAGLSVLTYDIDDDANEVSAGMGATIAESATAVANSTEVTLMSLPMPSDVRIVVQGTRGLLAASSPPRVVVDLSTTDPGTSRSLAAECRRRDIGYLDTPVLGRPRTCGSWTLVVGGDPADMEFARPFLSPLATNIVPVGTSGAGHAFKLLNNLMFGAINSSVVEVFSLVGRVGLDPQIFLQTVTESNAASVSNLLLEIGPKIINRDWAVDFSVDLLRKDIKLAIAMADETGVALPTARAVDLLNELGHAAGLGGLDTSALIQVLEDHTRSKP
jgi:3-hydroxyisobutyrate dehydrogenase-like beta-hydroxyacid dehydrogenase